jgi:SAM-dependent methyltransferase
VVLDLAGGLAPLGPAAFDTVLASNLLEHFTPDGAARLASGIHDVLKPGGRVILIQPNFRYAFRSYFDDYTHRAVFTDVSLPALLRASGFSIDRVAPRFLPYSMQSSRLPMTEGLVAAYLRSPFKPGAGQMLVVATKGPSDVR